MRVTYTWLFFFSVIWEELSTVLSTEACCWFQRTFNSCEQLSASCYTVILLDLTFPRGLFEFTTVWRLYTALWYSSGIQFYFNFKGNSLYLKSKVCFVLRPGSIWAWVGSPDFLSSAAVLTCYLKTPLEDKTDPRSSLPIRRRVSERPSDGNTSQAAPRESLFKQVTLRR